MSEILTPQNGDDSRDDRPRLVLDTNTVLALWMFRDPKLEALREWIEAGNCRLCSRPDALDELRSVLAYRQFALNEASQQHIHAHFESLLPRPDDRLEWIASEKLISLPRCQDADDQKFLEIALLDQATHLLTRDKALLKLARHRAIRDRFMILTPERFVSPPPWSRS